MALRYVFDEHLRGTLPQIVVRYARRQGFEIDVMQIGEAPDLPLGTLDADLLRWAENHDRIIVSHDSRTLPTHLAAHLASGRHTLLEFSLRACR